MAGRIYSASRIWRSLTAMCYRSFCRASDGLGQRISALRWPPSWRAARLPDRQMKVRHQTNSWPGSDTELRQSLIPVTLAELRQFRREGALVDALSQDGFPLALLDAIRREATIPLQGGEIRCRKTPLFDQVAAPERLVVRRSGAEQSNSSMIFDDYGILKTYRRLQPGRHPEIEMSRFLVERAGFANTPP